MGSITKRGDRWLLRWVRLDGTRGARTCPDAGTAKVLERQIEQLKALGQDWSPRRSEPVPSLSDALAAYLEHRAPSLAYQTLRRLDYQLMLAARFAETQVEDPTVQVLDRGFLTRWERWLSDPATRTDGRGESGGRGARAPTTVRATLSTLEVAWRWLDESGLYPDGVVPRPRTSSMRVRRARGGDREPPTWAEWDAMLRELRATAWTYRSRAVADSPWDWCVRLALLARYTAERRTALLHLTWDMVDLDALRLSIPAELRKGEYSARVTPLHPALAEEMAGWGTRTGRVVGATASELSGRGHADLVVRKAWMRAGVDPAKWTGRPLHCARHTWETWLIGRGEGVETASLLIGHEIPGTGGRSYLARDAALLARWDHLAEVVAAVPAVRWKADGARLAAVRGGRRGPGEPGPGS